MPRSSRPADKRRQPSTVPARGAARDYGSVDGKRYAGTVLGPEETWRDEGAPFDGEPGSDEWE